MRTPLPLRTLCFFLISALFAQENAGYAQSTSRTELLNTVEKTFGNPASGTRLDPSRRVWIRKDEQQVIVDGYIALRSGQLEMFACLAGTKEHESIVAVFSSAQLVHTGLLAIGSKSGTPVKWEPEYQAPTGDEISVTVLWKDKSGETKQVNAREWIRIAGTEDQTLDTNFVFAGSIFWQDPETKENRYMAESGDFICVSNFSTATLDVPLESSQANSGLMFAAFTDLIPEIGTPIRLVLAPTKQGKETQTPKPSDGEAKDSATESPDATADSKPKSSQKETKFPRLSDEEVKAVVGEGA